MDRVNGDYAISLDYAAKLINDMNFDEVTIREPHSDATLNKINKSEPDWWCKDRLTSVVELCGANSLFYPDKGAANRYVECNFNLPFGIGDKTRNFFDAALQNYKINGIVEKHVLIVDDLCSRGGTFVFASKFLRKAGAISVYLLVAHCEENVFNGEIFNYIDRIYTAKDLPLADHPRITKID
jgi:ribose-phosphate pyrophosphokinase